MFKYFKFIKYLIGIIVLWFIIHSIYIIRDGLFDKKQPADVAIVLGNKINEDGTPSERLKARLNQALALYHEHRVKMIVVSGGLGKEGFLEGDKMRHYLIQNNVPSNLIIVDNHGDNTEKTVKNAIHIMDSLHFKSAISVSQYFHQTRIKKLFKNNGEEHIESSSPNYFELRDFYSIFREFFAYYW